MREIILAKTAGFCFGVKRAIEMAEQIAGEKVFSARELRNNGFSDKI